MNDLNFLIERINNFSEKHSFEFNLLGVTTGKAKIKITGVKDYIRIGEVTPHLEYTLEIQPNNEIADNLMVLYRDNFGDDVKITTTSREYDSIIQSITRVLEDFLKWFGLDLPVICTRVINKVNMTELNEQIIFESKSDGIIRKLVKDIFQVYKHQREGTFHLPEDIAGDEMVYDFPRINTKFSINLELILDPTIKDFEIEGDYYKDDDTIEITIITNPNLTKVHLQELIKELNEVVGHELEHIKQIERGYVFGKEPVNSFDYYQQPHEIEAQRAGFKRRSKKELRSLEDVAREWFNKYPEKHRLKKDEVEKVIEKLLKK